MAEKLANITVKFDAETLRQIEERFDHLEKRLTYNIDALIALKKRITFLVETSMELGIEPPPESG